MQTYANKDTIAISHLIQAWRKPTNPITKSKLVVADEVRDKISSKDFTFRIGSPFADAGVNEIKALIKAKSHFAVLTPLTLLPEIARLENDNEGEPQYDAEISAAVSKLCKIVIASTSECWLVSCPGMKVQSDILLAESQETSSDAVVGGTILLTDQNEVVTLAGTAQYPSEVPSTRYFLKYPRYFL